MIASLRDYETNNIQVVLGLNFTTQKPTETVVEDMPDSLPQNDHEFRLTLEGD